MKAKNILITNHQSSLFYVAGSLPNNIMDRHDKVQFGNIILIQLIESGGFSTRRKIKFNNYLIRIVKFRLIDEIRKLLKGLPNYSITNDNIRNKHTDENIEESFEQTELKENLITAIQKLPRTEQIIMGCKLNGMSHNEIASQCGASAGRISQIVNKAKKTLKISLSY